MPKITLQELQENNRGYAYGAKMLNEVDLKIVNSLIELIESSRADVPKSLDNVVYINQYGEYFANGMMEENTYHDGEPCIVESASAHIYKCKDGSIGFSSGGGAYRGHKTLSRFQYAGKTKRRFWTWSSAGAGASQGIYFDAEVNNWKYTDENLYHGEYTTKDYNRYYIHSSSKPDEYGYKYYITAGGSSRNAFKTELELAAWKKTYRAVEFKGHNNSSVVFTYREQVHRVPEAEWDMLEYPVDTRLNNGIREVKVNYDDVNHIINVYYCTGGKYGNNIKELDYKKFRPYQMAMFELSEERTRK